MRKIAPLLLCALWLCADPGRAGAGDLRRHHLVSLDVVQPPALPEVRYATQHNFTGTAVYPFPRLWLQSDTARALTRVQRELQKEGLGLKVFDAYRPLSVQQKMWDLIRDDRYVSDPAKNRGRHTRGTAVDVTLVDRRGQQLPMPSDFDDFTPKAHRGYEGGTAEQRRNRAKLEAVMKRHGFVPYPDEWWHFDLDGWERYPVFDISLESLAGGETLARPVPPLDGVKPRGPSGPGP
jgi:zinc D-Ala-D-Ala dipeptidase